MAYDPEFGSPWPCLAWIVLALTGAWMVGYVVGETAEPRIVSFQDLGRQMYGLRNPKGQPAPEGGGLSEIGLQHIGTPVGWASVHRFEALDSIVAG